MRNTLSTMWRLFGGALLTLTFAASHERTATADPSPLALTLKETTATCIPQAELRKRAEARCEALEALITKVRFTDLCGANGAEAMYSTVLFECFPKRRRAD